MPSCDYYISQFSSYLDEDIPEHERAAFETHVSDCKTCSSMLEDMRTLQLRLRDLSQVETSPTFMPILWARIRCEERRGIDWRSWFDWALRPAVAYGAAFAAVVTLGLFLWFGSSNSPNLTEREQQGMIDLPRASDASVTDPTLADAQYTVEFVLDQIPFDSLSSLSLIRTSDESKKTASAKSGEAAGGKGAPDSRKSAASEGDEYTF